MEGLRKALKLEAPKETAPQVEVKVKEVEEVERKEVEAEEMEVEEVEVKMEEREGRRTMEEELDKEVMEAGRRSKGALPWYPLSPSPILSLILSFTSIIHFL